MCRECSDDIELIKQLNSNYHDKTLKRGKVRKNTFQILNTNIKIDSWKFNEWDYGKSETLVSQARGLFTLNDEKIIIRGYDKFFNVDELPITRWQNLVESTRGPYYLTLKENGCIIFISGLEDGTIVVCSKHSTGERDDVNRNHALYGQKMLENQLNSKNIDIKNFAKYLYENNLTAVAELCDDEFEEHVLEYSKKRSGLYLHGLNMNQVNFMTLSMEKVHEFSKMFGFKEIEFTVIDDINHLQQILTDCSKTGTYDGREAEGFVIRCKNLQDEDFFFKYKFEEPYLMYRSWREVTKEIISGKPIEELKISKHKYQTLKYIAFIMPILSSNPDLKEKYLNNHGIIDLRNQFLNHYGKKGFEVANYEDKDFDMELALSSLNLTSVSQNTITKYIIVPVATIGCGKTTIAISLTKLFPHWSHIQNDNIPNPVKDKFIRGALELLENSDCCIMDRNNHQFRERKQIFEDFNKLNKGKYNLKFICLNFFPEDKDKIKSKLWEITYKRVSARGNNHQSIKAGEKGMNDVANIMKGFIGRFQNVDPTRQPDSLFNLIIDMEWDETENTNLKNLYKIITQIKQSFPEIIPEIPSDEAIHNSFQDALSYEPNFSKIVKSSSSKSNRNKKQQPIYFSIGIKNPDLIISKIENLLSHNTSNEDIVNLYQLLKETDRIQKEFHVTLTHRNDKNVNIFNDYVENYFLKDINEILKANEGGNLRGRTFKLTKPLTPFTLILKKLCGDGKLLCIECDINQLKLGDDENKKLWMNKYNHITVGTLNNGVAPFLSNRVLRNLNDFHDKSCFSIDWNELDSERIINFEDLELLVNF
ncbi:hypothetical protein PACTADRAFT_2192 [Pachysolen tannophilus NRRL Y-2460]|uniref:tRNA ligase n=1 Tax=Pachysolen tannophilus NRRL Y-2460 TaxID=669874 RepID=A0A1E4TVS1_PACTA|nr:hypothetical protein PACTADRAFT_2192 [Pachysolen tannophilus NRRL Y-2460]